MCASYLANKVRYNLNWATFKEFKNPRNMREKFDFFFVRYLNCKRDKSVRYLLAVPTCIRNPPPFSLIPSYWRRKNNSSTPKLETYFKSTILTVICGRNLLNTNFKSTILTVICGRNLLNTNFKQEVNTHLLTFDWIFFFCFSLFFCWTG
jgi:hypothetical protein